jgi:hypothetical protein
MSPFQERYTEKVAKYFFPLYLKNQTIGGESVRARVSLAKFSRFLTFKATGGLTEVNLAFFPNQRLRLRVTFKNSPHLHG